MILIYDMLDPTVKYPLQLDGNKAYREHKYDGLDLLQFEIQRSHEMYKNIAEEVIVEGFENRFIVKQIDEHSDFVTVKCKLDLDEWKQVVKKNYRPTNSTIGQVLNQLIPSGWTVDYGAGVDTTKRTTVEEYEGRPFRAAVPYDIMPKVSTAFGVVFNYDVINKKLSVINPDSYEASGEFFSEDVNMKSIGFNGSTEGFATRLYPYGKSDEDTGEYLTIASVNGGLEYVEDNSYSSKIVSICWVDERYTDPSVLKSDAEAKLRAVAEPLRSYTCDVLNFDEDFWLYKVVTIIDVNREQRIDHQVVSYREYEDHSNDIVTLSQRPPDISNTVIGLSTAVADLDVSQVFMQQYILSELQATSDMITGSKGGSFRWVYDNQNRPRELVNLGDSDNINTAQKVWRWNAGGLGHSNTGYAGPYDLALTADGKINASMITAGILNANIIRAGVIQDLTGNNWWNLETGQMRLQSLDAQFVSSDGVIASINASSEAIVINAQKIDLQGMVTFTKQSIANAMSGNLLERTDDFYNWNFWTVTGATRVVTESEHRVDITVPVANGSGVFHSDALDLEPGQVYTFSCYAKFTGDLGSFSVGIYNASSIVDQYNLRFGAEELSSEWKKVSAQFTAAATTNGPYRVHLINYTGASLSTQAVLSLKEVKIEKGEIATDWTPSWKDNTLASELIQGTTVINGGCITTGTIDASLVNVTNLNANNITAGILKSQNGNTQYNLNDSEIVFGGLNPQNLDFIRLVLKDGAYPLSIYTREQAPSGSWNLTGGITMYNLNGINFAGLQVGIIDISQLQVRQLGGSSVTSILNYQSDGDIVLSNLSMIRSQRTWFGPNNIDLSVAQWVRKQFHDGSYGWVLMNTSA